MLLTTDSPDPYAILTALGVQHPITVTPVTGGADTRLWRVQDADQVYALRVFDLEKRDDYHREQAAMGLAATANLPVPRIIAAEICGDNPALLLSWCVGRPLREQIRLQPWRIWALGRSFGEMQARTHAVAVPAGLDDTLANWMSWKVGDDTLLQQALDRLTAGSPSLLHLDYHLKNVIVARNQVTGIIDWANVHLGDKRADVARTYTILRVEPWVAKPSLGLNLLRWLLEKAWWYGYGQVAGLPDKMPLFYVWAGEVMVRDLAHRVDQPGNWFQQHHLAEIQAWTQRWKERAGLGVVIK